MKTARHSTKNLSEPMNGDFWMNDTDDVQIKAEIDGIMKGVKDIMKKIDAATPKEEPEPDPAGDQGEKPDSFSTNLAQNE
jgi:hypothetical protein